MVELREFAETRSTGERGVNSVLRWDTEAGVVPVHPTPGTERARSRPEVSSDGMGPYIYPGVARVYRSIDSITKEHAWGEWNAISLDMLEKWRFNLFLKTPTVMLLAAFSLLIGGLFQRIWLLGPSVLHIFVPLAVFEF